MTFEQGPLWGGSKIYSLNYSDALIDAFSNFVVDAPTDDLAHLYLAFASADVFGGKPIANASIFQEVNQIPALLDATGIHNMTYLAAALNQTTFSRYVLNTPQNVTILTYFAEKRGSR
jgi:hypothetical protein